MDLDLSAEDETFRQEVRAFVRAELPADIRRKVALGQTLLKDDYIRWQKILYRRGWIAPGWPEEHGGTGWTPVRKYLFEEECAVGGCPRVIPFGLTMVGPVIIAFGSDAQKRDHLPKIRSSDVWWCQGYSEPGAGSDLASLATRAVRDGDHYVVSGQKTWTTFAQHADWIFCLVRTDPDAKKQEGISFLLIDMKSPGIAVRPIRTLDGGTEVNDVFFDSVRVPAENLVGGENRGWTVAKFLLGHERMSIAEVGKSKFYLDKLKAIAATELSDGLPLIDDPAFREKIAQAEIDLMALDMTILRYVSAESAGRPPGPEASLLKIKGTDVQQALTELLVEALGYYAAPYVREAMDHGWNEAPVGPDYAAPLAPLYFNMRKTSIYGGSNEIQRGILARMVLGM